MSVSSVWCIHWSLMSIFYILLNRILSNVCICRMLFMSDCSLVTVSLSSVICCFYGLGAFVHCFSGLEDWIAIKFLFLHTDSSLPRCYVQQTASRDYNKQTRPSGQRHSLPGWPIGCLHRHPDRIRIRIRISFCPEWYDLTHVRSLVLVLIS